MKQLSQNPITETGKLSQRSFEILATISHEIRNPLNAVIGLTHLLQESPSEVERKLYTDSLMETSENLRELINNIMDLSKMEAGRLELLPKSTNLKKTLNQILLSQKGIAEQHGLNFIVELDPQIPEFVKVDSVKLIQVLLNLISNAIKFTERGSITVKLEVEEFLEDKFRINFKVIDSGIGIPPEKLQSIFEAFNQGGAEINRVYGGTGLGLSISRKIVETMGGTLRVQSKFGQGSNFCFSLDLAISKVEKATPNNVELQGAKTLQKVPRKFLIVDDNKLNNLILQKYLELWGWNYETAYTGLEAVEKVQNENFDMVFMDLHMPGMDGLETVRIIRTLGSGKYEKLPVICLTASAEKFVEKKVYLAGFTDLLIKPYKPKDLLEKVKLYIPTNTLQSQSSLI